MLGYTTTIMQDLPSHYDSLEQTLQSAESILEDAIRNAKNLFHTGHLSHSAEGIQTRPLCCVILSKIPESFGFIPICAHRKLRSYKPIQQRLCKVTTQA